LIERSKTNSGFVGCQHGVAIICQMIEIMFSGQVFGKVGLAFVIPWCWECSLC
jgi:hypothetical protein